MGNIKDNDEVEKIKKDINTNYTTKYVYMPLKDLPEVIEDLKAKVNPISETISDKCKSDVDKFEKLYNNIISKPFDSFKLENIKLYLMLYEALKTIKGLRYESHVLSVKKEYDKIMEQIIKKIKEIKSDFTITEDVDLYDVLYDFLKNPPTLPDVKDNVEKDVNVSPTLHVKTAEVKDEKDTAQNPIDENANKNADNKDKRKELNNKGKSAKVSPE